METADWVVIAKKKSNLGPDCQVKEFGLYLVVSRETLKVFGP